MLELVGTLDVRVDEHLLGGDIVDGEGHGVDAVHGIKSFFVFGVEVLGDPTASVGGGWAERVRRPSARKVVRRLLARVSSQYHSVASMEVGGRDSSSMPQESRSCGGPQPAAGPEAHLSSRCERCAYVFVPETYATVRAGASR
eukprot:Tamp_15981.p2 GENE.Tamp_15981~~Tamp_15981.p2  ORF type:complete len:143 (+),score=4.67 Tamp_15981:854-1282(+)